MKIKKIELMTLSSKFGKTKTFGSPKSLKIISLIKIYTDTKLVGFGEIYLGIYISPKIILKIVELIEKMIKGKNPIKLIENNYFPHIPFVSRNGIFNSIYSGVDIALWDIYANHKKLPLHKCFSNKKNKYNIYSSGGMIKDKLKEIKKDISYASILNHKAFKIRAGFFSWKKDSKKIEYAKNETSKRNMRLMVDMIMGTIKPSNKFSFYKNKLKFLSKLKLEWLEEPFYPDDASDHISLKKTKAVKIASGEALNSNLEYEFFIKNKLVDVIQLDVTHCGGFSKAIKIIKIAKKYNCKVALHVWGSKIAQLANAHLALAFSEIKWLECPVVEPSLNKFISTRVNEKKHLLEQNLDIGLGVSLDDKILKKRFKYVEDSEYKI
jgi:D-galactarolactone cycloisomerase